MTRQLEDISMARVLQQAAARGTLAPSVHNSQPWRFEVGPGRIDLYADENRKLAATDPTGRELTISCGAALFHVRTALAAAHVEAETMLTPDPSRPTLLASVVVLGPTSSVDAAAARLDVAAESRRTNRRGYSPYPLPADLLATLITAVVEEGARLQPVLDDADIAFVAGIAQLAASLQDTDPAYRDELHDWTAARIGRLDGLPKSSVPTASPGATGVANRDFDQDGDATLPAVPEPGGTIMLLSTEGDSVRDWMNAGQGLARLLLELTAQGYVAHPMTQAVEVARTRHLLYRQLTVDGVVQLLIRAGRARATSGTSRRAARDVVDAPQPRSH